MLGFLGLRKFEDGAIRGAILVTDKDTNPIEFRVTAPVRPTNLQTTLYGELLDEHIAVKLLGDSLLNAVEQKPDLVIVRDPLFLRLNIEQSIPTIRLVREDEPNFSKEGTTRKLESQNSERPPIKVCTSSPIEKKIEEISQQLQFIFLHRDLIEPFDRLDKACSDVHSQKLGDL